MPLFLVAFPFNKWCFVKIQSAQEHPCLCDVAPLGASFRFQLEDGDCQPVSGETFLWPEGDAGGATSKGTSALKRFFQCGFETTVPAPCFPSLISLMACLHSQHTGCLCSAFPPAPLPGIPAVGGRVGGGLPVGLRSSGSSPPRLGENDIKEGSASSLFRPLLSPFQEAQLPQHSPAVG